MNLPATVVLLVYAVLMLAGGFAGFRVAGSIASFLAGSASALLLLVAFIVSRYRPAAGFGFGAGIALLLTVVFIIRLKKTGTFMPSCVLLLASVMALVILALAAAGQ